MNMDMKSILKNNRLKKKDKREKKNMRYTRKTGEAKAERKIGMVTKQEEVVGVRKITNETP
jgi:hypothetical protein